VSDSTVSLPQFLAAAELLDLAFAGPSPAPDLLAHKCEMAERALFGLVAEHGSTSEALLAAKFSIPLR
jgi:hypothetical protein